MKQRIFLLLFVAIAAFHPQQTQAQPGDRGQGFTPEERAEQQTVMMTEKLSLSEAQVAKDKEVLEDLIAAAVNDAVRKVENISQEKMSGATAGLGLPAGMKLPF